MRALRASRRCESCGKPQRVLEPARIGDTLADDVESSTVRGCGEDGLQPGGDSDTFVEAEELGRNLSLVVIHHHDPIELSSFRPQKDCVRRQWTGGSDPLPFELVKRRADDATWPNASDAKLRNAHLAVVDRGKGSQHLSGRQAMSRL